MACMTFRALLAITALFLAIGTARAAEDTCTKNHYILDFPCQSNVLRDWDWTLTGALSVPRTGHTATLLDDGRVLVAGGHGGSGSSIHASAELFDPATNTWSLAAPMNIPRSSHTAIRLADGRVLVSGNLRPASTSLGIVASAEVYDPRTNAWSVVAAPNVPRAVHTMTLLADGTVLAAGGVDNDDVALRSAETFDPRTGRWEFTAPMITGRFNHTATKLPDGMVLATGGSIDDFFAVAIADAELYDPVARHWMPAARLSVAREWHRATLLRDGRVLIVGGYAHMPVAMDRGAYYTPTSYATVESYGTQGWALARPMQMPRTGHAVAALPAGMVLASGGKDWLATRVEWWSTSASAEIFDPATNGWLLAPPMRVERSMHTATALDDGRVLVTGGFNGSPLAANVANASTEVFGPGQRSSMSVARAGRR
jgi:hypothetical protein